MLFPTRYWTKFSQFTALQSVYSSYRTVLGKREIESNFLWNYSIVITPYTWQPDLHASLAVEYIQQTQNVETSMFYCWPNVCDAGPTFI